VSLLWVLKAYAGMGAAAIGCIALWWLLAAVMRWWES
jgi:hypothetical protein